MVPKCSCEDKELNDETMKELTEETDEEYNKRCLEDERETTN